MKFFQILANCGMYVLCTYKILRASPLIAFFWNFFPLPRYKTLAYGRIHLHLTDRPSVVCVIKKLSCISFEFNENWCSCSYLCVLKLHQVSLNSNEKQKSFLMTHLKDGLSLKGW